MSDSHDGTEKISGYYLSKACEIYGPLPVEDIQSGIQDGRISAREWIFLTDPGEWYPLVEIPQLAGLFYSPLDKPSKPPATQPLRRTPGGTLASVGMEKIEFGGQLVEKRRWIRLPGPLMLRFSLEAGADPRRVFEAVTADISEGGLGFSWPSQVPIDTFMRVDLEIFPHMLKTKGKIASCRPNEKGEFSIGVLFVNLTENDRKNLRIYFASSGAGAI